MMAKVEVVSKVVKIEQAAENIYGFLSDFNKIGSLVNMIRQMGNLDNMAQMAGAKGEDISKLKDTFEDIRFTDDICYIKLRNIGEIALQILEREEPKLIKLGGVFPFEYFIWIQLLKDAPYQSRMRITFRGEMNVMYKMLLKGKLEKGIDSLAEGLCKIPYSMIH